MKNIRNSYASNYYRKILVPVFWGCKTHMGISIARKIAGDSAILLIGMVGIDEEESLSTGATRSQELRRELHEILRGSKMHSRSSVLVSHHLWSALLRIIQEESPQLLVLDYPRHIEWLRVTTQNVLQEIPCDIALVRGPIPVDINKLLVPIRGGPNAELALRVSLALSHSLKTRCTSLHLVSSSGHQRHEEPFRVLSGIIKQIPELEVLEMDSDKPTETILEVANDFDLIVMGSAAQPSSQGDSLGKVTGRLMKASPVGMVVVKTHRTEDFEAVGSRVGRQAISVLVDRWFAQNTYHSAEFEDIRDLVKQKEQQELSISIALPALNEELTVGKVIRTIKSELMDKIPLLDEIVLMDSNSVDSTRDIAMDLGIPVYIHQHVLADYGARQGKGEALWKSLFVTRGDIVLWIDTDIVNIHPRFIYGLIGPLLVDPKVQFVKGFYRRPIKVGERILAGGGGRVTELTARPLINLFFPELSGVIQPLSGEYGGRRSLLERLPFFSGYGVEIGLLIDVFKQSGLDGIAQVDLKERIHHNQPLEALSKMSFAIIQAVSRKLDTYYSYSGLEEINQTMKLIRYENGRLYLDLEEIAENDRPPIADLPEYRELRGL